MKKAKSKKSIILLLTTIMLAIILVLGFYGYYKVLSAEVMYEGVTVDKFDISFMTKEEALKFLKDEKDREIDEKNMRLTYEDKKYNINLRQLGFYFAYEEAVNEAYSVGREGNVIIRLKNIISTKKSGANIPLKADYDKDKIDDIVNVISEEIDLDMKEASFNFNNGNIRITDEVIGKSVDKEGLNQLIDDNIYTLNNIEIPVEKIIPKKTKEQLKKINGVIGEFSTSFKTSSSDRRENIKISSKSISNTLLMPGDSVSFNDTTGPRDKKFGYKEANVIISGELTPGVGGGVCQTSTTLYNALLLANVTVIERHPHSIPANYVKFGQDAAVAFGYLDLKFRNDFDFPIYIHSKVVGDRVYMYVYGDRNAKDYTVKIEPEIIETIPSKEEVVIDKNLSPGVKEMVQKGRTGYRVKTYKSVIKNGKVISRELINSDHYRMRNFIYRVGPTTSVINDITEDENIVEENNPDD